jgi:hypothetical protein
VNVGLRVEGEGGVVVVYRRENLEAGFAMAPGQAPAGQDNTNQHVIRIQSLEPLQWQGGPVSMDLMAYTIF